MKKITPAFAALLISFCLLTCDHPATEEPVPVENIIHISVDQTLTGASSADVVLSSLENVTLKFSILSSGVVKVFATGCQIYDSSGYGYADALIEGSQIDADACTWTQTESALSASVGNGGQFKNAGIRFLGFRYATGAGYNYGWVRLNCSDNGNQLEIIDFAVNQLIDDSIFAGQTSSHQTFTAAPVNIVPVENVTDILGIYRDNPDPTIGLCNIYVTASDDPAFDFNVQFFPFMWPFPKIPGKIVNGNLLLPDFPYSGNIPTPGGTERLYDATIAGTGYMDVSGQQVSLVLNINYNQTGFSANSFNGQFTMYKCD